MLLDEFVDIDYGFMGWLCYNLWLLWVLLLGFILIFVKMVIEGEDFVVIVFREYLRIKIV